MPFITRRRAGPFVFDWPVTDGLWALYWAGSPNNTLTGEPNDKCTVLHDESGQGRDATSATGETWEPEGLSTSMPCLRNNADRLLINDGVLSLTSSKISFFTIGQGTSFQFCIDQGSGDAMVGITLTGDGNSPIVRDSLQNQIVLGIVGGIEYFTDFGDEVARSWGFVYEDAGNIADFYVSGALTNEVGDDFYNTNTVGSFIPKTIMRIDDSVTNRQAILAIYDDKLLTAQEMSDLHDYCKDVLELIA